MSDSEYQKEEQPKRNKNGLSEKEWSTAFCCIERAAPVKAGTVSQSCTDERNSVFYNDSLAPAQGSFH